MKILLLTQFFDPEPAFKATCFARALRKRGHQVVVLTGYPNYPGGEIYPGYKMKPFRIECQDGIKVIRVALYPSHNKSSLERAANYLSFMVSSIVPGLFLTGRPDVIYCYHPPVTSGLAAVLLSKAKGIPFVYDVQDLWPDSVALSGMVRNDWLLGAIRIACETIYRSAAHVTVLSPGFRDELTRRGIPSRKISVIYNWCDEESLSCRRNHHNERVLERMAGKFNITFAGNMGIAQSLETVLEAAGFLRQDFPEIQFNFVGEGTDKTRLQRIAASRGLRNVNFFARLDPDEMGPVLEYSGVLLVHLKKDPLFTITIPSKIQAYLCAGKPVLTALQGDAANLVLRAKAGLVCPPDNPQALAECAVRFYRMSEDERSEMGRSGQRFYRNELCLARGVREFERIFNEAIEK